MTETLKDLMRDRADAVDFQAPDLSAITRDGSRRVRRRRLGLAAAGGALTLAVAVPLALTVGSGTPDGTVKDDSGVVAGPSTTGGEFSRGPLTYAVGSEIHYGDRIVDAGVPVDAFVQTTAGFVVASAGDVYEVDGSGAQKVGEISVESPRLVSDEDGTLAGWVQAGKQPSFVIQDLAADVTSVEAVEGSADPKELADGEDPAYFYALDDGVAYVRDSRGAVAIQVSTGQARVVDAEAINGFDLIDAQANQVAFYGNDGVSVGPTKQSAAPLLSVLESEGKLSPDATYYAPDAENLRVVTVRDGADATPALSGYFFSTAYGWLDDTTVAVIGLKESEKSPVALLSCSVTERTCAGSVEIGSINEVQLPVGFTLGDG